MVPLPLDVVGDVLDLLRLAAGPVGDVFGRVFDVVDAVVEFVLDAVFVVVKAFFVAFPVFLCVALAYSIGEDCDGGTY